MAVNEWKESGILRDDARVFPPGIAEGELEKSYPEQLQTREIPNKDILQHIIQALGHLLMTDGDNPCCKASIKIDLLSYQWYVPRCIRKDHIVLMAELLPVCSSRRPPPPHARAQRAPNEPS